MVKTGVTSQRGSGTRSTRTLGFVVEHENRANDITGAWNDTEADGHGEGCVCNEAESLEEDIACRVERDFEYRSDNPTSIRKEPAC